MRRPIVATTAAALAALVVAAPVAAEGRFEGVTLTVGTFGGSWKDRLEEYMTPKFEAEGGKIEFITGNPRNLLSKLIAARGQDAPMDVIEIVESTPLVKTIDVRGDEGVELVRVFLEGDSVDKRFAEPVQHL